jgi:ABC-type nitrate/sulfonate/bicarbonate transport system substrate-binding protein
MRKDTNKPNEALSRRNFVGAAGAAGAVAAGGAFVPKKVFAQKKVTVKYTLGWLPEGANIWSYAAKQFWAKAGIDVVIEKGSGSAAATQAIAQGKYEFGIPAAPNSIQQAVKGLPLLSLGCFNYDTTMGVAVRPESPIKAPADLKGKKMRIQSSKVLEEQMRSLGSLPQVMAFSEVYQALQTGVVDGTENPISNLYTQKMHEVQKHLTVTDHGYLGYAVIVNKKFWDGLPADIRKQLDEAMVQATRYANQIAKVENDNALAAVKASGKTTVYVPTAEERAAFKKVLVPVHQKMAGRIGKETIDNVYKATGFNPNK